MPATRIAAACCLTLSIALPAQPAFAQIADNVVLEILRQCARIDDATARLACFDNNIRSAGATVPARPAAVPGAMATPQGSNSAPLASGGAAGFGREDIRDPSRFRTPEGELEALEARVSAVEEQREGIYLVTLEDGAQWVFAEGVPFSYRPPREGSRITIERGSLGSFLMRFDRQPVVQVRRLR